MAATECRVCGSREIVPRSALCKPHRKEYAKEHYNQNRRVYIERATISTREQRIRNRQWLIDFLRTKECIDCGNIDIEVLQFDHRDRELKTAMVYKFWASNLKRLQKEVDKCDIRCANCHMKRSRRQMGWWTDDQEVC